MRCDVRLGQLWRYTHPEDRESHAVVLVVGQADDTHKTSIRRCRHVILTGMYMRCLHDRSEECWSFDDRYDWELISDA